MYHTLYNHILLTKTTVAQNEVALNYHGMRGLYFLAIIFASTTVGSCALNALFKPNALNARKDQKALLIPEIKYKVTDTRNKHTSVAVKFSVLRITEKEWIFLNKFRVPDMPEYCTCELGVGTNPTPGNGWRSTDNFFWLYLVYVLPGESLRLWIQGWEEVFRENRVEGPSW